MSRQLLMAGGGIGALSAALAATRAGWEVRLYEQAQAFSEVGAGLQLGPNATRVLHDWGLGHALSQVACFPEALVARSAASGRSLGLLPLGTRCHTRYGAPYATVHRHDLHQLQAGRSQGSLRLGAAFLGGCHPRQIQSVCLRLHGRSQGCWRRR